MLWIAGILGILAVGAASFIEFGENDDEDDLDFALSTDPELDFQNGDLLKGSVENSEDDTSHDDLSLSKQQKHIDSSEPLLLTDPINIGDLRDSDCLKADDNGMGEDTSKTNFDEQGLVSSKSAQLSNFSSDVNFHNGPQYDYLNDETSVHVLGDNVGKELSSKTNGIPSFLRGEHPFDIQSQPFETDLQASEKPDFGEIVSQKLGSEGSLSVAEFDAQEDELILVWDDEDGAEPELSLEPQKEKPEFVNVLLNGNVVATIPAKTGLTSHHISLMPLSDVSVFEFA